MDKSQVSRWFSGNTPRDEALIGIANVLSLNSPEELFRDPEDDWMRRMFEGRSRDEKEALRKAFEAIAEAMPKRA